MLFGELEVPQELGVHPLHLVPGLGRGLPRGVAVSLPVLIMIRVILRLGHDERNSEKNEKCLIIKAATFSLSLFYSVDSKNRLFVVLFLLVLLVVDLEVSQLVGVLRSGDDAEPIAQVVLLQVLFREVLEIALGEGDARRQHHLVLLAGQRDVLAEVARLPVHLDAVLQVGLKGNRNAC